VIDIQNICIHYPHSTWYFNTSHQKEKNAPKTHNQSGIIFTPIPIAIILHHPFPSPSTQEIVQYKLKPTKKTLKRQPTEN
jgi:hypothetical protein